MTRTLLCDVCGTRLDEGAHQLSPEEASAWPFEFCPKCSGGPEDGRVRCVAATALHYRCSCGVRWSVSRR